MGDAGAGRRIERGGTRLVVIAGGTLRIGG